MARTNETNEEYQARVEANRKALLEQFNDEWDGEFTNADDAWDEFAIKQQRDYDALPWWKKLF